MNPSFIHLHTHSEFSLRDSILDIEEIVNFAAENGMHSIALTDKNNIFAAIKFYKAARKKHIKPIIGCDLTVRDHEGTFQIILLVKNFRGFFNLCSHITTIYKYDQKNGEIALDIERFTPETCEGLIALSGGLEGDLARYVHDDAKAETRIQFWREIFADEYFLQIALHGKEAEEKFATACQRWSLEFKTPAVATNLACFAQTEDFDKHEIRTCIASGDTIHDKNRPRFFTPEHYLLNTTEMAAKFPPTLLENSEKIAQKCNLELTLGKSFLPEFPLPEGMNANEYLAKCSREGLKLRLEKLYPDAVIREEKRPIYEARLEREISVIQEMGFSGYFLIVMDFIQWAKKHRIPVGPGRGSGVGSLVAFSLLITNLDPLPYDLLFERFLNPERISMPDFDVDFCQNRRDEVIKYVSKKYGAERVSQIATFNTMAAKGIIRDVGRVLGLPYVVTDRIAKMIPKVLGIELLDALGRSERVKNSNPDNDFSKMVSPELIQSYNENDETRQLLDICLDLEGLTRGVGRHAGGVVIAPSDMSNFSALYSDEAGGAVATQFYKDDIEAIGLVKFDFLGLRNLTAIDLTLRYIGDAAPDLEMLKYDDPKIYELITNGKTDAVFQLESEGMKKLCREFCPSTFEDLIMLIALFRPGPLGSGMVQEITANRHGHGNNIVLHPLIEAVLKPTYGVFVYQEQVMQAAQVLAGYTLGNADILRRAMGKKDAKAMEKQRATFVKGAAENGIDTEKALEIFSYMEKFAEYGFNKSHSAAYAMVAYQTAWLKVYFPAEFMAAILATEMENTEKVVRGIHECEDIGLTVIAPNINRSEFMFTANKNSEVIFGLGAIKGVGEAAVSQIIDERNANGVFVSFADFCQRIDLKKINRRTMETLIYAGVFDEFSKNRGGLIQLVPKAMQLSEQKFNQMRSQHDDIFGGVFSECNQEDNSLIPNDNDELNCLQQLEEEYKVLGLYMSDIPLNTYRKEINQIMNGKDIAGIFLDSDQWNAKDKPNFIVAGMITHTKEISTKNKEALIFITLQDTSGEIELNLLGNEKCDKFRHLLKNFSLVCIKCEGRYRFDKKEWNFSVNEIMNLQDASLSLTRKVSIKIDINKHMDFVYFLREQLIHATQDGVRIMLDIQLDEEKICGQLLLQDSYIFNQEIAKLLEQKFGQENIKFTY